MIALAQQGKQQGADAGHASGETSGGDAALHARDLVLQRLDRGIHLPAVGITGRIALKDGSKFFRAFITEGHGGMHGLVQ